MDIDKLLDKFNEREGITYELRAINGDGEVIAQETSKVGFDDVSGFSYLLDQQIIKMATESAEDYEDFSEASND